MRLIRAHDPDLIVSTYPGTTAGPGRAAPQRPPEGPVLLVDHRPRRAAHLGAPGDRPALHHPPGVARGGRADRRSRAACAGPSRRPRRRSWSRARAPRRGRRWGCRRTGTVIAVSGGGWGVGDLVGADRGGARGRRGRRGAVPVRPQRDRCASASTAALRRRPAGAGDGLHRPDGRRARRLRRADPLERRADRARGDHPRLPGDLLRLRLRARARLQPGARALQARAGRAQRGRSSRRRSSGRSRCSPSPTPRSRSGRRRRR